MVRLFSFILLLCLAVLCIGLAVENRQEVTVSLGPIALAHTPLFFVFFAGLVLGIIVVGLRAWLSKFTLKHRLRKSEKALDALRDERDAIAADRDNLAARVRPEDERLKQAQLSDVTPAGTLTGPAAPGQTVLPG